ncbi:unnamed protein product [Ectocarpus sp. 4 AP-2014]
MHGTSLLPEPFAVEKHDRSRKTGQVVQVSGQKSRSQVPAVSVDRFSHREKPKVFCSSVPESTVENASSEQCHSSTPVQDADVHCATLPKPLCSSTAHPRRQAEGL